MHIGGGLMGVCTYCDGDAAVEVFGLWVHKLPDRWISCNFKNQKCLSKNNQTKNHETYPHDVQLTSAKTDER